MSLRPRVPVGHGEPASSGGRRADAAGAVRPRQARGRRRPAVPSPGAAGNARRLRSPPRLRSPRHPRSAWLCARPASALAQARARPGVCALPGVCARHGVCARRRRLRSPRRLARPGVCAAPASALAPAGGTGPVTGSDSGLPRAAAAATGDGPLCRRFRRGHPSAPRPACRTALRPWHRRASRPRPDRAGRVPPGAAPSAGASASPAAATWLSCRTAWPRRTGRRPAPAACPPPSVAPVRSPGCRPAGGPPGPGRGRSGSPAAGPPARPGGAMRPHRMRLSHPGFRGRRPGRAAAASDMADRLEPERHARPQHSASPR